VLELNDVLAAGVALGQGEPCAVIEDVAVLQNLHKRGALVSGGVLQRFFQVTLEDVDRAGDEGGFGADGERNWVNGRSRDPKGVDFAFLLSSEVGEY